MNTSPSNQELRKRVHRDYLGAMILGPVRVIVPIVGYFLLFPYIQQTAGFAVLGIWAQLRALHQVIGMGDVGFSTLLSREAGRDRSPEEQQAARNDFEAARRFYIIILVALLGLVLIGGRPMVEALNWDQHYNTEALVVVLLVFVAAVILHLIAFLYYAVLLARNDATIVLTINGFMPLFPLFGTFIGVALGYTLEGLAYGTLLGSIVRYFIYRWRLSAKHAEWVAIKSDLPLSQTFRQIVSFSERSWRFYFISVGRTLREPVFRFTMGAILGAEAVGVYAIAFQAVTSIRALIAAGGDTLLPGMAVLHRTDQRPEVIRLIRLTEIVLTALGAFLLGFVILFSDYLYALWLGIENVPQDIHLITFYLAFWQVITLHNLPIFKYLEASGNEGAIIYGLYFHTISMLMIVPLSQFIEFDLQSLMLIWMVTGVIMQLIVYGIAERRLGCVLDTLRDRAVAIIVPAAWLFLFSALGVRLAFDTTLLSSILYVDWQRFVITAVTLLAYVAVAAYVTAPYANDLFKRLKPYLDKFTARFRAKSA